MSVRLSKKHGVNPALMLCIVCGDEYGVALPGRLKGDVEAPRQSVWEMTPCDKCKEIIDKGAVALIECRDGSQGNNPYRTGRVWFVKKEKLEELADFPPNNGYAFIEESVAKLLGLHEVLPDEV